MSPNKISDLPVSDLPLNSLPLIDTHTHFDMPIFRQNHQELAQQAWQNGVRHLVLVGYVQRYFARMQATKNYFDSLKCLSANDAIDTSAATGSPVPKVSVAVGLHPAYIHEHKQTDWSLLAEFIKSHKPIAIGEIGMDTYRDDLKTAEAIKKQTQFFLAQLDLAVEHQLPVMLHIRKAHAQCLKILKNHRYDAHHLGGIAHSFSGGEQEAIAFAKLGFRLGVTGQVTNPNAKKLRRSLQAVVTKYGIESLVIETDCPDMLPHICHSPPMVSQSDTPKSIQQVNTLADDEKINVPANLVYVLDTLSKLFAISPQKLAQQLWQNSCEALQIPYKYPI